MTYLPQIYLLTTVLLVSVAYTLFRHTELAAAEENSKSTVLINIQFAISGVLIGAAIITWLQTVNSLPVSVAYPALSLVYVCVLILSKIALDEIIPPLRMLGMAFVLAGVAVLIEGTV